MEFFLPLLVGERKKGEISTQGLGTFGGIVNGLVIIPGFGGGLKGVIKKLFPHFGT